jgi:hypothetical protein
MSSPEMTNTQILTIAIALATSFSAVLIGVLLNNTRLNDVKELLAAKVAAGSAELRLVIERNHSEMMAKLLEIERRVVHLETERRIVQ